MDRAKTLLLACIIALAWQPAGAAEPPLLLTGADLHTVSHGVIPDGQILLVDGRIAALGDSVEAPSDARRIALDGKRIYPGLIAAGTVLGLNAVPSVRASLDATEIGINNADVRAELAVDPDADAWAVTRANGVLSALVVPQAEGGALITGQSALLRTDGWTNAGLLLKSGVGVHLQWPGERTLPGAGGEAPLETLERIFREARAYAAARQPAVARAPDLRLQALAVVIERRQPLFIHAETALQIRQALAFVRREQVDAVLVGGRDAWRLANSLREQRIPVILGTAHRLPGRRWEGYDVIYAGAGRLAQAGVTLAIANDGSPTAERNLPYQAATYAAYGLEPAAALRAITLAAAEILGVDDRLGSLDVGKAATLFVADGDILEIPTRVERAWIDGREVELESRHTRLRDQYRRRYDAATP